MIDQNTVVQVTFGKQQIINLGLLSVFEYTQPGSNGRFKLTFSRHGSSINKDELGEMVKHITKVIEVSLISDNKQHTYTAILEDVRIKSSEEWELLDITAVCV